MRETTVTISTPCISLLVGVLLLSSLVPFSSSIFRSADAEVTTAISPTGGTGSPTSLGTIITSGTSTIPTPLCSASCVITGGTRAGNNLFHSFGDFNIGALDSARFQTGLVNPLPDTSVSNILARVTGGPSNLFGNLNSATFYPSANLFLVNPAGFLFGPNATVNIGGMATFTTADYIRLTDGGRFSAHPNVMPSNILTAAPVAAFGFLGSNPAAITFEGGQLAVGEGTGLALVGGDISLVPDSSGMPSGITTSGRSIQLSSLAGPGEVAADTAVPTPGMSLGTITLDHGTVLSTGGDLANGDGSGGSVSIRGGQLVATGATIITSPAEGSVGSGGAVIVDVTGSATFIENQVITGPVAFSLAGSAGPVSIMANESLSMTNTTIDATSFFAGGDAGPVTLQTNGPLALTDSRILTFASAPGNGGTVTIMGKDVTFNNSGVFTDVDTGIFDLTLDPPALGLVHPGAVTVTAQDTMTLSGSASGDLIISATAFGTLLNAGSITITGKTVNLSNGRIDASLNDGGIASSANGGTIEIRGNNVNSTRFELFSNAINIFESSGTGGSILIRGVDNLRAENIQLANSNVNTASGGGGGGGPIEFQTKTLTLSDHTVVATDSFGPGSGGTITVRGAENVTIESGSRVLTDVVIGSPGAPQGTAGDIFFETQNLTLRSGGLIRAGALPNSTGNAGNIMVYVDSPAQSILIDGTGSGIFSTAEGTGAGGNINLFANTVTVQNGGTIATSTSGNAVAAKGGNVTITAGQSVNLLNHASVTASSTGPGNAGNILINAGQNYTSTDSAVTTQAAQASGGNITVLATDSVQLTNSQINASVQGSEMTIGGNIVIDPQFVILQNSQILARATQGQGGNISITTNLLLADPTSVISASSERGVNGTVTIQSPNAPGSGKIQPLGKTPLQATSLLNQHCAALAGGEFSSFTVAGRDSLPTEPGSWLASPLALGPAGFSPGTVTVGGEQARFVDPADETTLLSLRQIAPAGFLTQAFAVDWSAGCQS
jgi:filamentous hemagglutinin family protein